jgi:hypothetical protein
MKNKKAIDKRYAHQLPEINLTIKFTPLFSHQVR